MHKNNHIINAIFAKKTFTLVSIRCLAVTMIVIMIYVFNATKQKKIKSAIMIINLLYAKIKKIENILLINLFVKNVINNEHVMRNQCHVAYVNVIYV
jgi:hypothetical protein